MDEKIFREYDIRGIAGENLTEEVAVDVGRAFGVSLRSLNSEARCVSVGRDVRLSSDSLAKGIISGITSAGIDVYDLGVCPTPIQYYSLYSLNLDGGIMVTGSHNPPEYNGFKLSIGKDTIHGGDIQRLRDIISRHEWTSAGSKGNVKKYEIIDAYVNHMTNEFSYLNTPKYKKMKVVIDSGNGTAGMVVPRILNNVGCEVIQLYCEPDGNFPNHHPDPTVIANMQDLISETKRSEADIGIGYDGDADRIGVVNRDGDIVWGDHLMIVLSRELLRHNPGAKIIGDVKCSEVMFDDIRRHGGRPVMWKTGHSLVKQKMREEAALLAGEFSGHIFIKDRYFGYDDAIYATLRLIEIMKCSGKGIRDLLSDVPQMFHTPEIRIDCPDNIKRDIVEKIVKRFTDYKENGSSQYIIKDLIITDGVRITFEKGWGLIRMSNTQPVVVMRVEASDKQGLDNYRAFLEKEFKKAMGSI